MKRFLLFAGLIGAAVYALAPPHTGPTGEPEAAFVKQHVKEPLRTSWGSSLQALKREPAQSKDIESSSRNLTHDWEQRQEVGDRQLVIGGSEVDPLARTEEALAAYIKTYNAPPTVGSDSAHTELWVIGQTIGWIQPEDAGAQERGWASYAYIASVDDLALVVDDTDADSAKRQKPSQRAARVANTPEPKRPESKSGPDDTKIAKPNHPRGLFTRAADGQRGRGLFGRFKARKAERRAWSVGPSS